MKRMDEAALTAQAADAAQFFIKSHCPHADVYEMSERTSDFTKGFCTGVRFREQYDGQVELEADKKPA
jgi:hypothetical protein